MKGDFTPMRVKLKENEIDAFQMVTSLRFHILVWFPQMQALRQFQCRWFIWEVGTEYWQGNEELT